MSLVEHIEALIDPTLTSLGLGVVRVQLSGSQRMKLQVIIERLDGNPVAMDNCVKASREISAILDVEDPIESAYTLEVSSPGEDRPLVKEKDYVRFQGNRILVQTKTSIEGRRKFTGLLTQVTDGCITLQAESEKEGEDAQAFVFPLGSIQSAKLQPKY